MTARKYGGYSLRFAWTEERVDQLKANWAKGMSAGEIVRDFGYSISRNAVLGKLHRLGLLGNRRTPQAASSRNRRVIPDMPGTRPRDASPKIAVPAKERKAGGFAALNATRRLDSRLAASPGYVERCEPVDAQPPLMLSLDDLTPTTCRWPIGDPAQPGFGFCGHYCHPAVPYCEPHMRQASETPAQAMARERWRHEKQTGTGRAARIKSRDMAYAH